MSPTSASTCVATPPASVSCTGDQLLQRLGVARATNTVHYSTALPLAQGVTFDM